MVSSHYISPYHGSLQVSQADTVLDHQNHEKLEQYDSFSLYTVYVWWADIFANVRGFIHLKTTWLLQYLLQTKRTSAHFPLYYIIMRLHCFLCILIDILRSNELCPWNNSLRTEAELTLTDHIFNQWFVWFILVWVHWQKWMTDNGHYFYTIN